jgi:hypothetical protein
MIETDALLAALRRQGWRIESGGRHHKCYSPDSGLVVVSKTPGDHRSLRNAVAELKRHGFVPESKSKKTGREIPELRQVEIWQQLGVEPTDFEKVVKFPHITDILGRRRDHRWFYKDGSPIPDESWNEVPDAVIYTAVNKSRTNASDRSKWIEFCALKFWADPRDKTRPAEDGGPTVCECGARFPELLGLASHVLTHGEREDAGHYPSGTLEWYDASLVANLFDDGDVAELQAENRLLRKALNEAQIEREALAQIRSILDGVSL